MNPKTRRHVDGRPRPRRRTPPHPRPRGHQDFVRVLLVIQCVGSTGGAAGPHYLATGKLELLSESQFVDCDHEEDACGLVMRRRQWHGGRISGKNQLTKYSCARVHTDQARLRTMQRILLWLVLSLSPYMMREMWDLSSNFFLSDDDIGKNRAVAWVSKLQELNNVVDISALTEELTTEHLSKFQEIAWTHVI